MRDQSNIQSEIRKKKRSDLLRMAVMGSIILLTFIGVGYWFLQDRYMSSQKEYIDVAKNVQYLGTDKDGNFYKFYGDVISKDKNSDQEFYIIKYPIIEYLEDHKKWMRVSSKVADYNKDEEWTILKNDVQFYTSDGVIFFTEKATINLNTMFVDGSDYISGKGELFDLEAQSGFKMDKDQKNIIFYGPVTLDLNREESDEPIHVTADEFLEINQQAEYYLAQGNAHATLHTGEEVDANKLFAYYDESSGSTELKRIKGISHIKINKDNLLISGDRFDYDMVNQNLQVDGKLIHVYAKNGHLISHQNFQYLEAKNLVLAKKNVVLDNLAGDKVYCDDLSAQLTGDQNSKEIVVANLKGHVKVVTKKGDIAYSDRAIYDKAKEKIYLYDHVVLDRGQSRLMGDEAVINMATGKSYLINKPQKQKQIIGILKKQN